MTFNHGISFIYVRGVEIVFEHRAENNGMKVEILETMGL